MRAPALVLLSSVALALLVRADEVRVTAPLAPPSAVSKVESTKEIPVGKGIVYTKTSFFANKMEATPEDEIKKERIASKDTTEKKDGLRETVQSSANFVSKLLGIDIGIGIGGGDGTKKHNVGDDAWYNKPLYGDDGYIPRPVPKGCDTLEFTDQMIWDQQGSVDGPRPINPHMDKVTTYKKDTVDTTTPKVEAAKPVAVAVPEEKEEDQKVEAAEPVVTIVPEEKKENQKVDEKQWDLEIAEKKEDTKTEDTKETAVEGAKADSIQKEDIGEKKEDDSAVLIENKEIIGDDEKMNADGICILGICLGSNNDDDDDDDDRRSHAIIHKQARFLRQFRGKRLSIDPQSGCPLAYTR